MYRNIDTPKLMDVQDVVNNLTKLPEKNLLYIAGYVQGALDSISKQEIEQRNA